MKIRVLDFETTDSDKAKAAGRPVGICEAGWTDVTSDGRVHHPRSALVNAGLPIMPAARGVHHISDADLTDAITPDRAFSVLMDGMEPGDMFAAHNAAFERLFFGGGPYPWICTMICAKHLYEDAPDFKNQTLRYWLGVDEEFMWPDLTMPPHRAGPDSYVTAHVLARLMLLATPGKLVDLTTTPVLQKHVPFGKYEGQLWSDMDRGFLEWILNKDFNEEVKSTARHWLNQHSAGAATNPFGN